MVVIYDQSDSNNEHEQNLFIVERSANKPQSPRVRVWIRTTYSVLQNVKFTAVAGPVIMQSKFCSNLYQNNKAF